MVQESSYFSFMCFGLCRLRYGDGLHGNHKVMNLPCIGLVENVFGVVSIRTRAASKEREVGSVGVNGVVHVAVLICCFDEDSLRR